MRLKVAATTLAVAAGALCTGMVAPARAQPPAPPITAMVPSDGGALLAFRLPEIEDGFAFADLLSGLYPDLARLVSRLRAPLALASLSESALAVHGIRADEASMASLARVPAKLPVRTPGLGHRLVVPVTDVAAFLPYAQEVLTRAGFLAFNARDAKAKPPTWAKPLAALIKKSRIALLGHAPDTASGVAVRWQGSANNVTGFAIIDVFVPTAPPSKPKQAPSLFAAGMKATLEDDGFEPLQQTWTQGTRSRLSDRASFVLVLQPDALVNALAPKCQAKWRASTGAFFSEAAVTARLHPFDWKLKVAFQPTAAAAGVLRQANSNDGLIDARALAAAGLAAGILYTKAAGDWAQLPRPAALGATWQDTARAFEDCGMAAMAIALVTSWPHMLTGLWSERLQPLGSPEWLQRARNLALGLSKPFDPTSASRTAPQRWASTWMASFEATFHGDASRWLSQHSTREPEAASFGERTATLWALRPNAQVDAARTAGLEALPSGRFGMALSPLETGLDWYYAQKRRPAVFGNRAAIGSLHINVGRILNQAAEESDTATRDAVALATSQLSMLGGDLVVNGELLELDLSFAGNGI